MSYYVYFFNYRAAGPFNTLIDAINWRLSVIKFHKATLENVVSYRYE